MLSGLLYLIAGWLVVMSIGFIAIWLYKTITGIPKKVKKGVQNTFDKAVDRAFEKIPQQTIEEHKHYTDVKILNVNEKV